MPKCITGDRYIEWVKEKEAMKEAELKEKQQRQAERLQKKLKKDEELREKKARLEQKRKDREDANKKRIEQKKRKVQAEEKILRDIAASDSDDNITFKLTDFSRWEKPYN
ncbi:hypothetical protein DPMN_025959 [Dreissena polymorpha]|uniref:Uncharacterized protein n=1 Tax=Dreissena polymorpha TaxID=45954 RepID=A0A9D4LSH0_DREPO|nr:hypothetical protein DPMN_025959 [Dreissena polymorpha]